MFFLLNKLKKIPFQFFQKKTATCSPCTFRVEPGRAHHRQRARKNCKKQGNPSKTKQKQGKIKQNKGKQVKHKQNQTKNKSELTGLFDPFQGL